MHKIKLILLLPALFLNVSCGGSSGSDSPDSSVLEGIVSVSDLPERALTESEISSISYSCDTFDVSETEIDCISFVMREVDDLDEAISVDIEGFSEQDLMERLEILFPDPSLAPIIVLYTDGLLEDGLTNNGFNLYLK